MLLFSDPLESFVNLLFISLTIKESCISVIAALYTACIEDGVPLRTLLFNISKRYLFGGLRNIHMPIPRIKNPLVHM